NDKDCLLDVVMIFTTDYSEEINWNKQDLSNEIKAISIGREEELALKNDAVSRHHASFLNTSKGWAILDLHSKNGVYVNGNRVDESVYLNKMDVITIANYVFLYTGTQLIYQAENTFNASRGVSASKQDALKISIEERNVWHRMRKKTLLKNINLEIPQGSMVLILGGSGAGKTTFMNAVMGYERADARIVYKNRDIYAEYERMKSEIGYVPQQDLMRMNDTVYKTLFDAAKMRLPENTTSYYEKKVEETLATLGLERERSTMVRQLSGGQRKRLSIAIEYIGDPSLFFLDEPDSGLDGTMSRSLMESLRNIANQGKICLIISHAPDRAFDLFDQIIILAKGRDDTGHLVFTGSPKEGLEFFEVDSLEKIVKRINRKDEGGEGRADEFISKWESRR
ncbi:MAG: ATP-binding cassette domain-containing protein, partial [Erysipelotrichaceae bacterium]|nr:ATP-binding cassette domain-containing protein [Erysipelotrichaceae bacterium]